MYNIPTESLYSGIMGIFKIRFSMSAFWFIAVFERDGLSRIDWFYPKASIVGCQSKWNGLFSLWVNWFRSFSNLDSFSGYRLFILVLYTGTRFDGGGRVEGGGWGERKNEKQRQNYRRRKKEVEEDKEEEEEKKWKHYYLVGNLFASTRRPHLPPRECVQLVIFFVPALILNTWENVIFDVEK